MKQDKGIQILLSVQGYEITEYVLFNRLAKNVKDPKNRQIMKELADGSLKHYNAIKEITNLDAKANGFLISLYLLSAKFLGLTFTIKLMEKREEKAEKIYYDLTKKYPALQWIIKEEQEHEKMTIGLIDEDILHYMGSVVLGLSDALVELTGALAGFTLAMQNNKLIASAGLITGIAASLSMASSEYLSKKTENGNKHPFRAALYTGTAYVLTVILLILPYFISTNYLISLCCTLIVAALIIFTFSFYSSISQGVPFGKRFRENITISFGVAALTFGIGYLVRTFLHLEI